MRLLPANQRAAWSKADIFTLIGSIVGVLTLIAAVLTIPGVLKDSRSKSQPKPESHITNETLPRTDSQQPVRVEGKSPLYQEKRTTYTHESPGSIETRNDLQTLRVEVKRVFESCRETADAFKRCGQSGVLQDNIEANLQELGSAPASIERELALGDIEAAKKQIRTARLKINAVQIQCDPSIVCSH